MTPTLGLALIARDEEESLPALLASIAGAFDQVALLDTGSSDGTVAVFERWAEAEGLPLGYVVDRFEWRDDFAAARTAADALLEADWLAWADCDDKIVGADCLRDVAARADAAGATWIRAGYFFPLPTAPSARRAWRNSPRERIFRRGHGRWRFPVHESKWTDGGYLELHPPSCRWEHRRYAARRSSCSRNLRITRAWVEREPGDLYALYTAAREELIAAILYDDLGDVDRGLDHALGFLGQRAARRAYGPRRLAAARRLIELGGAGDADALADLTAVGLLDPRTWPQSSSSGIGKASIEVKTGNVSPSAVSPRALRSATSA